MRFYAIAPSIALFCAVGLAGQIQLLPPPLPSPSNTGPTVVVQLNKGLSAKKLKIGNKVTASVIQDVISRGRVVIHRESVLAGHIVEVAAVTRGDPRSRLAIVFDQVRLKNVVVPIRGVIQALAPPLRKDLLFETSMSSSPYDAEENGHPVHDALMSKGQTNTPTVITGVRTRDTRARALQERERALENTDESDSPERVPQGALTVASRGVFRLPGLFLADNAPAGPTIVAVGQNVELKTGAQLVLRLDALPGLGE